MSETPPVLIPKESKPLSGWEKFLSVVLIVLGLALVVGTLIWFGGSTKDGGLVSKEITTTEPAAGEKTTEETDYADSVVIFVLTIGTILALSGAFFGRIKEIKVGNVVLAMQAPEEEVRKAKEKAEEVARQNATRDVDEAASLAATFAEQQVNLAYITAPPGTKGSVAEAVGEAAGVTAASAYQ